MITAEIIADSINGHNNRIVTYVLKYPRFIHSELMTHRVFSRNAASSRAIPITKMIDDIKNEIGMPAIWGRNQKGMQASEELTLPEANQARDIWRRAMESSVAFTNELFDMGVHKQIANRLLEPFAHMVTLVTATEWNNFFVLRAHKDAQPEFQILAYKMLGKFLSSTPAQKKPGEWHIPFGDSMPDGLSSLDKVKIATARAARISYKTFEGEIDTAKDLALHDRLSQSGHWSPFEHPAMCDSDANYHGNFRGWIQYRKMFDGLDDKQDCNVDLQAIYDSRPKHIDYY